MNLLSVNEIKQLLSRYGAQPSKTMGQNFLVDERTLNKIIETAKLSKNDTVLEIGPGIGTLTCELAKRATQIISMEKDPAMIAILKETLKNYNNVQVAQGNALKFDPKNYNLKNRNYKVVANIPYYLTSPLIRKFLEEKRKPSAMVLMIQKEVAQRICAKPPDMSLLAASVQFYAEAEIIYYVSKNCFWPSPSVDSAIIKIIPFEKVRGGSTPADFFAIVKTGFSQPRKQLLNNFSKTLKKDKKEIEAWLLKNDILPTQRAETLSVADWERLTNTLNL